jgi:hypothetical protein
MRDAPTSVIIQDRYCLGVGGAPVNAPPAKPYVPTYITLRHQGETNTP